MNLFYRSLSPSNSAVAHIAIMLAVLLSYALPPIVDRLHQWLIPRAVAVTLVLLSIVGGIGSLAYSLSDDMAELIETLPAATIRRSATRVPPGGLACSTAQTHPDSMAQAHAMNSGTFKRRATTVAFSAALATISFAAHAQLQPQFSYLWEAEANNDPQVNQDEKVNEKSHRQQQRLSMEQQQERIRQQHENLALYRKNIALRQSIAKQNAQQLQRQKRLANYRFQQSYYERLRQQQAQLPDDRHDFSNDPFHYTAPNYRYRHDGRSYETNQYGANMLRQAASTGYQQGLQAGHADKQDNWRFDYKQSFAYEDANYGYDGRYVRQDDYNHYFREGFQRGYEDGYYDRRKYGTSTDGSDSLLGTVLNAILKLETLQ